MGKQSGKSPVKQTMSEKLVDKLPTAMGDKVAQGWSEKRLIKRASMADNAQVTAMVMQKAIVKDKDGNEVDRYNVQDKVPYVVASATTGKNIGWVMRKGVAGVGRIYQSSDYELLKNDPDRPKELDDFDFDTMEPSEFGLDDDMFDGREGIDIDDSQDFDESDEYDG